MKRSGPRRVLAIALPAIVAASAVLASLAQDPAPAPAPPPKPEAPPATPAPPVIDGTARFDLSTYEATLGRIAAAYPDLVRMRTLGKSRGGRDVWLAVAADDAGGDAGRRPAAVVVTDLAPVTRETIAEPASAIPRVAGPEAALFALSSLLERARSDPKTRERLLQCAVYFLPAPDPDGAFPATEADAAPAPRRSRLDRNFPAGWQPYDADPKSPGPYPLCEPESQLLARFLLERANVSALVSLGAGKTQEELAGKAAGGTLESYVCEVLDATVLRPAPWSGPARTSSIGTAPEGFYAAAAQLEKVLDDLPRLECGAATVERLKPDVWLVDLPLTNAGSLPTGSRSGRTGAVQLKASGPKVVACAVGTGESGNFEAVRGARGAWPLGSLEGKATLAVRLVVQGEEGASLDAVFESTRSGRSHASVVLR